VAVDVAIAIVWAVFWLGWLVAAFTAKQPTARRRGRPIAVVIIVIGVVIIRAVRPGGPSGLLTTSSVVRGVGAALVAAGLATAVWARVTMGRDWGMPMTQRDEPHLVTGGPYRQIRHPIYSGIMLAMIGTGLAVNVGWLIIAGVTAVYFGYSATVEERMLVQEFPDSYPSYQAHTKMLIPFLL
jgi:protein-S-isoprenylcysteine O-methyltransferase Ste14